MSDGLRRVLFDGLILISGLPLESSAQLELKKLPEFASSELPALFPEVRKVLEAAEKESPQAPRNGQDLPRFMSVVEVGSAARSERTRSLSASTRTPDPVNEGCFPASFRPSGSRQISRTSKDRSARNQGACKTPLVFRTVGDKGASLSHRWHSARLRAANRWQAHAPKIGRASLWIEVKCLDCFLSP